MANYNFVRIHPQTGEILAGVATTGTPRGVVVDSTGAAIAVPYNNGIGGLQVLKGALGDRSFNSIRTLKRPLGFKNGGRQQGALTVTSTGTLTPTAMTAVVHTNSGATNVYLLALSGSDPEWTCSVVDVEGQAATNNITIHGNGFQLEDPSNPGTFGGTATIQTAWQAVTWIWLPGISKWKILSIGVSTGGGGGVHDYADLPGTSTSEFSGRGTVAEIVPTETRLSFGQANEVASFVSRVQTNNAGSLDGSSVSNVLGLYQITVTGHPFATGDLVYISNGSSAGIAAADGVHSVTVVDANTIRLNNTPYTGTWDGSTHLVVFPVLFAFQFPTANPYKVLWDFSMSVVAIDDGGSSGITVNLYRFDWVTSLYYGGGSVHNVDPVSPAPTNPLNVRAVVNGTTGAVPPSGWAFSLNFTNDSSGWVYATVLGAGAGNVKWSAIGQVQRRS